MQLDPRSDGLNRAPANTVRARDSALELRRPDGGTEALSIRAPFYKGTPYFGIDVSNWQRTLNWSAINEERPSEHEAKNNQPSRVADFAFLKLTEGATHRDKYAHTHAKKAAAVQIPFGYYHFARPGPSDAKQEAEAFCDALNDAPTPHLRPVLDIEQRGTSTDLTAWAITWCFRVEQLTGYRPIIYTYRNFVGVFGNMTYVNTIDPDNAMQISDYDLWLADYRTNDSHDHKVADHVFKEDATPFGIPIMHQFTGHGRVPGYKLDIDRNTAPSLDPLRVGYRRGATVTLDGKALQNEVERLSRVVEQNLVDWRALRTERDEMAALRDKANEYAKGMQAERDAAMLVGANAEALRTAAKAFLDE